MLQLSEKDATRTKNKVHLREMKKMPQEQKRKDEICCRESTEQCIVNIYETKVPRSSTTTCIATKDSPTNTIYNNICSHKCKHTKEK